MTYPPSSPRDTEDPEDAPHPLDGAIRGAVYAISICLIFWAIVGIILWTVFAS